MTDYKCPNCGGGFPESAAVDGECPWCARGMEGGSDSSPTSQPVVKHRLPVVPPAPAEPDGVGSPTPSGIFPQIDVSDPTTYIDSVGGDELLTRPTANPDASAGERIGTLAERGELVNSPIQERDDDTQPRRLAERLSNDIVKGGGRR